MPALTARERIFGLTRSHPDVVSIAAELGVEPDVIYKTLANPNYVPVLPGGSGGGAGLVKHEVYNAAQQTGLPVGSYGSASPPDLMSFTLSQATSVMLLYAAYTLAPPSGYLNAQLWLDGAVMVSEEGQPCEGRIGENATHWQLATFVSSAAGSRYLIPGSTGWSPTLGRGFGLPFITTLTAGAHTFEMRYNAAAATHAIKERRLIALELA